MTWAEHHEAGAAATFHGRDIAPGSGRSLWWFEVDRPTIVLGSTQPDAVLDPAAVERAGVTVARRRSGGGAVHLEPGGAWWVDVVIPRGDPLWDDDVSRAFLWLGDAWAAARSPRWGRRGRCTAAGSRPRPGRGSCASPGWVPAR